jgi:hypothetical protein
MTGILLALVAAPAGLALGIVHFALLRRSVDLYTGSRRGLAAAALTLGRIVGTLLFFALAARLGALTLLAAFLGFLSARAFALRAAQRVM